MNPTCHSYNIIDDLIYMLCGIDTSFMSIGMKNKKYALLFEKNYSDDYLLPFEDICINVRIIHKFIFKHINSNCPIKKLISGFFLQYKMLYLKKINLCRNTKELEVLYVNIKVDIEYFREFKSIIDIIRNIEDSLIYENIKNILDKDFYKDLKIKILDNINEGIFNWIIKGELSPSLDIKEKLFNPEDLEEGYWKSKYFSSTEINTEILKCGKLTNLLKILNKDIINKDLINKDIINKDIINKDIINKDIIITRGISGTLLYLKEVTYKFLYDDIKYELSILEDYIFMRNMSFYCDLFTDLYNDKSFNISSDFSIHSKENKKFIRKINLFKKIKTINFILSDTDLNNTIYKILNQTSQVKNNQSILEFLTVEFRPKILNFLLTKKNFLELELIFRFLFTLSVIQFFLMKNLNFKFSRLMVSFIQNFKFSIFSNIKNIDFLDIDRLVEDVTSTIKKYLSNLFLILGDVYLILSELIDLSFNFIGLEKKEECLNIEEFENKFFVIISELYFKLKKSNCDWWFINTLECLRQ